MEHKLQVYVNPMPRLCLLLIGASAFAQPPTDQPCRIEGQVMSATTGAPLQNATLKLRPWNPGPDGHTVTDFAADSDASGKFAFDLLANAKYMLSGEFTGYLSRRYEDLLDCGDSTQLKKNLVIKLAPQGLIFGRVLDDDGSPVPNARVEVVRKSYANGLGGLGPAGSQNSQDDGSFAIGKLSDGVYYVRAWRKPVEDRADGNFASKEQLAPAYFPDAPSVASASPITIGAGIEVKGIEVRLRRSRVFRVSRTVDARSLPPGTRDGPALALRREDGATWAFASVENSRFEFHNIYPGTYLITTEKDPVGWTSPQGSTTVTVGSQDVDNVTLKVSASFYLMGTVRFDRTTTAEQGSAPAKVSVMLRAPDRLSPDASGESDNDGALRVGLLWPKRYRIDAFPRTPDTYVKSIRFRGRDLTDHVIDLSPGAVDQIEVLLSGNAAHLTAIAKDASGQFAPHAMLKFCDSYDFCTGANSPEITFAPGKYLVYAWEDWAEGFIDDPEFRRRFESQAAKVTLAEKSHENIEVKLISKEAITAEVAKMP